MKEFSEASAALDTSKVIKSTTGELYGGDIANGKKFGYSTLLRAGMRLNKIDAALAQSTVQKAVAGGLMTANTINRLWETCQLYECSWSMLNRTEAAPIFI